MDNAELFPWDHFLSLQEDSLLDGLMELKNSSPNKFRKLNNEIRARALLDESNVPYSSLNMKRALQRVKVSRSHRLGLGWCRDNAERYINQLKADEFKGLFRMDVGLFNNILSRLDEYFNSNSRTWKRGKDATPLKFVLFGTLRWLAGGSTHDIIYFCGMRYRAFCKLRWKILEALVDVFFKEEIKLPDTEEKRRELSEEFAKKMGVFGVLGAIDGLLVHIKVPPKTKNCRPFLCYKHYYALNMQGIAGPNGEFLYCNIGHKGATGDGCASRQSMFWQRAKRNDFGHTDGFFLIGDAAYSLMPWLFTPYEGLNGVNTKEDVFNNRLSMARQVIERAFGMMISRWRILVASLSSQSVYKSTLIIKACCVLHNLCLKDFLSSDIRVNKEDLKKRAFNPKDKDNGVVEMVRLHVPGYRNPNQLFTEEEKATAIDKVNRIVASDKRDVIAQTLHDNGYRRLKPRGCKRAAAYQHAATSKRS